METATSLSSGDKATLLGLARRTIEYYLTHQEEPAAQTLGIPIGSALQSKRAAFVTLTRSTRLRGCIGDVLPCQPLYRSVMSNAVNAAVNDRRFARVSLVELSDLHIEISALTVPKEMDSYRDIRLGVDGIILQKDKLRAVFLPQVAPEQGWTLDETLSQLSQKAGLASGQWRQNATCLTVQAEVFGAWEHDTWRPADLPA